MCVCVNVRRACIMCMCVYLTTSDSISTSAISVSLVPAGREGGGEGGRELKYTTIFKTALT